MADELIGFHGGPPGTRLFNVTATFDGVTRPVRMIHVPDEEIVLPPDAPTWRVGPENHETPEEGR